MTVRSVDADRPSRALSGVDRDTKVAFLTVAPTPYYTPILNAIASRVRLQVVYVARERSSGKGRSLWSDFDDPWGQRPDFDHMYLPSVQLRLGKADFQTQVSIGSSRLLRRLAPDVLVVHSWGPQMVEPLLWARVTGRPSVMWVESTSKSGLLRGGLSTRIRRRIVRLADSYVSNGLDATDFAQTLGASPTRITTSCLPSSLAERLASMPRSEKPAGSPTNFLFVGRLVDLKRPLELARAFLSSPALAGSTLTMVGDGPLRDTLANLPSAAGRIWLLGRLEGEALAQAYLNGDVLVVPSHREVWGLVVNEALAAGLYVIASNRVGSTRDLLDEASGVVIDADDQRQLASAMEGAMQAEQSLSARQSRRNRAIGCTVDRFADDMVEAVSRALEARRSGATGKG
jgi:glycosyltransferase involved in cell wall biosynthesis